MAGPGSRWVVEVVLRWLALRRGGQGRPGCRSPGGGTGGWEGWAGRPTIEEVTMSMKSVLSGTEGLGGWEGQSSVCADLALSLALSFLTPPALRALSAAYAPCSGLLESPGLQPLESPQLPQPLPLAHPARGLGPAGLPFSHHLLLTPCDTLALAPDLCGLISQHSRPPPHPAPLGGAPLGIQLPPEVS